MSANCKKSKQLLFIFLLVIIIFITILPYLQQEDMAASCIFCDIANHKTNTKIVEETDDYVIFKDIRPASTYHYLAVSKKHIESLEKLSRKDDALVVKMEEGLKKYFKAENISTTDALFGFHLPPFISVKHLHMHAISPKSEMNLLHRIVFKPGTFWFKTVECARAYIKKKNP